jgi:hypothetical protein
MIINSVSFASILAADVHYTLPFTDTKPLFSLFGPRKKEKETEKELQNNNTKKSKAICCN